MTFADMNRARIATAAGIPIWQAAIQAHQQQIAKLETLIAAAEDYSAATEQVDDYKPLPEGLRGAMEAVDKSEGSKNGKGKT